MFLSFHKSFYHAYFTMPIQVSNDASIQQKDHEDNSEEESLWCRECSINFTSEYYLLQHLLHHIKQPSICIRPIQLAPIKLTIKSKNDNEFEIINSPATTLTLKENSKFMASEYYESDANERTCNSTTDKVQATETNKITEKTHVNGNETMDYSAEDPLSAGIPGAEPTPPPESPSEYPKIRIKTTGLLKEALTTAETPQNGNKNNFRTNDLVNISNETNNENTSNFWTTPCLEDPLKLPGNDQEDNILSSFLNNNTNDNHKDFGGASDNEFISLERLDDRNKNSVVPYISRNSSVSNNSSLNTLTGLPMQQLAEQVSRLQPTGSGMHQQNVLINIQQFPQAPPQPPHAYQHPPMYSAHPGIPSQPPPMYQPYQYQPQNPIYFSPTPGYGPAPHMPPPPQMQQSQMPSQQTMPPPPQQAQFRQPMSVRPGMRPYGPQQSVTRAPVARMSNPRQANPRPLLPRQSLAPRQRLPMLRPRGVSLPSTTRGPRPRIPNAATFNGLQTNMQNLQNMKRPTNQMPSQQIKKKKLDVLVPDKNDDPDCQVIAVQPKNSDGLPQIASVQGGTSDMTDNVMHLSDSITLSVRNPPPKATSPKKSDAKIVANILATRGITVTATPKPKEKSSKEEAPVPSVAINLNNAVSIIPAAKSSSSNIFNCTSNIAKDTSDTGLPMVDLTDDSVLDSSQNAPLSEQTSTKTITKNVQLPFKCDLCPSQYPKISALNKHRQMFHKTVASCELGIPLIDFKQPGILQKLSNLGIQNFIPLPSTSPNGTFGLPIVSLQSVKNPSIYNLSALGASSILPLGPVRPVLKSQSNNLTPQK